MPEAAAYISANRMALARTLARDDLPPQARIGSFGRVRSQRRRSMAVPGRPKARSADKTTVLALLRADQDHRV